MDAKEKNRSRPSLPTLILIGLAGRAATSTMTGAKRLALTGGTVLVVD